MLSCSGSGGSLVFGDTRHGIAFAYTTNTLDQVRRCRFLFCAAPPSWFLLSSQISQEPPRRKALVDALYECLAAQFNEQNGGEAGGIKSKL